jgi:Xaa-Pro dipeptidase
MQPPLFNAGAYGKANRAKVVSQLQDGIIFVKGGSLQERKWTDTELKFRQESFFFYLTGCQEPGFSLTINVSSGSASLYIPNYGPDYDLWHGKPMTPDQVKALFQVENVYLEDQLPSVLGSAIKIHVLELGECSLPTATCGPLKTALIEARVIKSQIEIDLMRYAAYISGQAHIQLMKCVKPGMTERELHALFEYECSRNNCHTQAYNPIVAAGKRGSTLHYGQNSGVLPANPQELLLVDAGCEYMCYASDITRTYPSGGVYSDEYKTTYKIVLDAQKAVLENLRSGVLWEDMHRLASRVILKGLIQVNYV